jgi:hypothetical protein
MIVGLELERLSFLPGMDKKAGVFCIIVIIVIESR